MKRVKRCVKDVMSHIREEVIASRGGSGVRGGHRSKGGRTKRILME